MPDWLITLLSTAGSVVLTLTITLLFNKLVALPKELQKQKAAEEAAAAAREAELRAEIEKLRRDNANRDTEIESLRTEISNLQTNHLQNLQVQERLQSADREILIACTEIKDSMIENRTILNDRLDRLERRERNALRQKILQEHRIFVDETMNPMRAWTEMEHHSFFELVRDYEDLGGNDYVHSEVLPAMNRLRVISMSDRNTLYELMNSRRL